MATLTEPKPGKIIVLNGAPRSGKSSIARAIQALSSQPWIVYGVDAVMATTPQGLQPGIGLRPGGERPDLEPFVLASYLDLYESLRKLSKEGQSVVADTGHHDSYSKPLGILPACAQIVRELPAHLIGIRCPLGVIMERRAQTGWTAPVENAEKWQIAVHDPGIYDFEVETAASSPEECARQILDYVSGIVAPHAFRHLSELG